MPLSLVNKINVLKNEIIARGNIQHLSIFFRSRVINLSYGNFKFVQTLFQICFRSHEMIAIIKVS